MVRNDTYGSFAQAWAAENRLVSVTAGSDVTTFVYDADGNRVKTVKPDGTIIYTPFPNYEEEVRPAAPPPPPTTTPTVTPTTVPPTATPTQTAPPATATPTQTPPPPTATPTQTPPPPTATPATGPSPTPTATTGGGSSVTFAPEADSFTFGSQNNGSQTILRAQGGSQPMTAYLRFNVLNLSGTVTQAVLRLYVMDSNSDGLTVNSVADNSWDEMTLNNSNAPAVGGAIGSYGATTANSWIDVDVTGYVTGNGQYSLALTSGTTNILRWRSREHANAPQLIITTSGGSANSGQTEYVSWRGYSGGNAAPTATPGGHRPLKRGPSEPRWRPGEGPNLEASKNSGLSAKPNQNVNAAPARQTGETVIQRVTYSITGQAAAVRVSGDPAAANNGLFYIHSDHLGSTSALTKYSDGYIVTDSLARYAPFGDWRTEPTAGLTDRAFTGHKTNNTPATGSLGLIYMNDRYYAPGLGRFLSADTVVPDPQNPQSLNRYTYVLNSPLNFSDPTGHRPSDGCEYEGCTLTKPRSRYYYSEKYGYFDRSHFNNGGSPASIIEQVKAAYQNGGGVVSVDATLEIPDSVPYLGGGKILGYRSTYWVSGDMQEDQVNGVALGIHNDWSIKIENWQGRMPYSLGGPGTSFSIEDLPSNRLAFIAAATEWDPASLLLFLDAHSTEQSPPKWDVAVYHFMPMMVAPKRIYNREFTPLVSGEHVPWPAQLQIDPIRESSRLWGFVEDKQFFP